MERELSNKEKELLEVRGGSGERDRKKKREREREFTALLIPQKELQLKAKEKRLETLSKKSEVRRFISCLIK